MTDPMASLAHDEAVTRAEQLEVDRYEVDLDLTGLLEGDTVSSISTIRFRCSTPGTETFVDCVAEVVDATLNGVAIDPASAHCGRLPLTGLRKENILVVRARQDDTASSAGIQRSVDPSDQQVYVWTSFEPDDARRVWACFDQPDLKAVHCFTVTAPASWTVLSNTAPRSVEDCASGRMWIFDDTPRLSPYVVVVNAGPFHEIRAESGGYDLGLYCRQSLVPVLERDAEEILAITEHGLAWFGEKFAMPFPQRRYDQVFVPNMAGAMENWGAVTHSDDMLYRSRPSQAERSERAYVVLHEMAHMWFGDLVTMRWWDDLWLNEAFASWAGTWAAAAMPQFADAWARMLVVEKRAAYGQDMSPATHPIRGVVADLAGAAAQFDAITYSKGMSVLRQLVAYVGEPAFLAGLQSYFREHRWGNTVLTDLMDAIGAAAGQDLAGWTDAWLDHAGTDRISLDGDQVLVASTDGAPRPHRLDIASFTDAGTLVGTTELTTSGAEQPVVLPEAAVHLLNAGDLTFASTRTDPASRAWLRSRAGLLPDVMSRALAVMEVWDEMVRGETTGPELVSCVLSVLAVERDPELVGQLLGMVVEASEEWSAPDLLDDQLERTAAAALALTEVPACRMVALRALARCASTAEHFDRLAGPAARDMDLAWRVLARRASLGEYDAAQVASLQDRDPDPEGWVFALAVRTAQSDAAAKEEAWQATMVERRVPVTKGLGLLIRAFWRPGQRGLLRPFASRYLSMLRTLDGGMLHMIALVSWMYPSVVADAEFLAESKEIAADEDVAPVVRQRLVLANDELARQLRARFPRAATAD